MAKNKAYIAGFAATNFLEMIIQQPRMANQTYFLRSSRSAIANQRAARGAIYW